MPDDLYGKGFRAYCATDNRESDGKVSYKSDQDNVKNYNINISAVTNAFELARAIYNRATPLLEGSDPKFNHHFRLAVDSGTLTIYDHRRFDVTNYTDAEGNSLYQERGAKIVDGVNLEGSEPEPLDDSKEKVSYAKDLVIQHTDKANMNIHIKIPQMTPDHIFNPLPVAPSTIFDYPVTDKASRNALLGDPNPPGILDKGLQYMLDAVTSRQFATPIWQENSPNERVAHKKICLCTARRLFVCRLSLARACDRIAPHKF